MTEFILIIVLALVLFAAVSYFKVKKQIKNMINQLSDNQPRHHTISIELFDRDLELLALAINHLIEENSKMLLEMEKDNHYLKSSIADISHDMRTPLTSAIGYLQLLSRSKLEEGQQQYVDIALEKSQYLRKLLAEFFELSALSANDNVLDLKKIDLAGVVSEIILENASEFAQKGITPRFAMSDIPVFIFGDIGMLQRIIQNLVSNCLKYSCGDVVFDIYDNETVILTIENPVADTRKIDIERIFDRFYKTDSSRNGQGVGLGLAIAQLLVEKIGGSISAYINGNAIIIQLNFYKPDR